ncbi:MAG: amino acid permease [Planctomycetaceae bacterium]|nr:amino acid permease [Planctomycetaceae bacterium]
MASVDPSSSHPPAGAAAPTAKRKSPTPGQVLVVTSVMFTFISYWRTAAIVLCDLASTAYYIGGIVETQIGKAAPWFILAVMLFSYAVRSVYIESCSMFVRGGVYRVVKEAMGGGLAKLSVSALMFDYILTGPISGVSAGQYIIGLVGDLIGKSFSTEQMELGSAAIAVAITLFFWRVNIRGIHESSDKALKIMGATTVMALIMIIWCGATLIARPEKATLPTPVPDLSRADQPGSPKRDAEGEPILDALGKPLDPLGFIGRTPLGDALRPGHIHWLSLIGVLGIFVAFGHSILAMSGEETLAQVYREVESPKLTNFKKAAFVVFVYSLLLTSLISFFAVMIIPDDQRMAKYSGNLIGGLAMNVIGPLWAKLALNALVVGVGFLILSGAVNTAIVGSNGVLNRVSEDGVMPDWFLKPHPRYGTTYRLLNLVVGLQLFTIVASRGKVLTLGEAYAFGVVWSFVFKALAMLVLRFKEPGRREYEVPLNIRVGRYDVPLGIALIFLVLFITAVVNFMTKEVATISGVIFTAAFFAVFTGSELAHIRRTGKAAEHHEHLEQFNQSKADEITPAALGITNPYRKLVAIRSPYNLGMLEKCLSETDPETTDVVVMTANVLPPASGDSTPKITDQDRALLTAVVNLAEHAGKPVKPLIVPTNEPFYALARTARSIGAQELIMGMSNKFDPETLLDHVAFYWFHVCESEPAPITIRVLGKDRDVRLDIAGGSQIPKLVDRAAAAAKLLADLRASWHGVEKLLLAYDGSPLSADFLDTVLSFLDPDIAVTLVYVDERGEIFHADELDDVEMTIQQGVARARELGRKVDPLFLRGEAGPQIVMAAQEGKYDAIFMSLRGEYRRLDTTVLATTPRYVLQNAPCRVILGFAPKSIAQPENNAAAVPDATTTTA